MEWGQQMREHQTNMLDSTYQNSNYSFERETRKTLIIEVQDDDPTNYGTTPLVSTPDSGFSITLQEPFIIDKLSDVYLESFTTFYSEGNDDDASGGDMGFILKINEFNIQNNSNNSKLFNAIYIPNETSANNVAQVHKSKKLNYVCQINPCKLYNISGTITGIDGSAIFNTTARARFIAEFVIISRD
jgi:hypothetical protein